MSACVFVFLCFLFVDLCVSLFVSCLSVCHLICLFIVLLINECFVVSTVHSRAGFYEFHAFVLLSHTVQDDVYECAQQ